MIVSSQPVLKDKPLLLSIIVVSYNTAALTLQAVESAAKSCQASTLLQNMSEIIVVDNNSQDGSVQDIQNYARSAPVRVKVIANIDNKGFAAANNQGLLISRGQYALLLNSDTITPLGSLETLISTAHTTPTHPVTGQPIGIWAAELRNADGSIQYQGGDLPTLVGLLAQYFFLDDLPIIGQWLPSPQHTGRRQTHDYDEIELKGWVGGAALVITPSVLEKIGDLDEQIFMYGEDIEYCARAQKQGFASAICHTAPITHLQSQSSSSTNALSGEALGYLYFAKKYFPAWKYPLTWTILTLGCMTKMVIFGLMLKLHRSRQYAIVLGRLFGI